MKSIYYHFWQVVLCFRKLEMITKVYSSNCFYMPITIILGLMPQCHWKHKYFYWGKVSTESTNPKLQLIQHYFPRNLCSTITTQSILIMFLVLTAPYTEKFNNVDFLHHHIFWISQSLRFNIHLTTATENKQITEKFWLITKLL